MGAAGNSCCGGTCVAPGGVCCENALGDNFPCGAGSQCCGNACAGAGSKCCTNKHGYKYPVTAIRMQVCASPKSMMLFNLRTAKCCPVALILLVILTFCNAYIFDFFHPTCTDTI